MKNLLPINLLFIALFLLSSCGDDEKVDSVSLGEVDYFPITHEFLPYQDTDVWVFENEAGETITYNQDGGNTPSSLNINIELIGGSGDAFDLDNAYRFYKGKNLRVDYFPNDDDTQRAMSYSKFIFPYINLETGIEEIGMDHLLYDEIAFWGLLDGEEVAIVLFSSLRGNEEIFPEDLLESRQQFDEFHETIELGGIVYNNVYSNKREATAYINTEVGVIGVVKSDGEFWKLR